VTDQLTNNLNYTQLYSKRQQLHCTAAQIKPWPLPSKSSSPFSNSLALTQRPDIFSASSLELFFCVVKPSLPGFCIVCRNTLFSRSANWRFSDL